MHINNNIIILYNNNIDFTFSPPSVTQHYSSHNGRSPPGRGLPVHRHSRRYRPTAVPRGSTSDLPIWSSLLEEKVHSLQGESCSRPESSPVLRLTLTVAVALKGHSHTVSTVNTGCNLPLCFLCPNLWSTFFFYKHSYMFPGQRTASIFTHCFCFSSRITEVHMIWNSAACALG